MSNKMPCLFYTLFPISYLIPNFMLHLNVEALTLLSSLYVQDYHNKKGSQLINISSAGGYTIVPNGIVYCATKFYVNAFTEGLALELKQNNAQLKAKVLAPLQPKLTLEMSQLIRLILIMINLIQTIIHPKKWQIFSFNFTKATKLSVTSAVKLLNLTYPMDFFKMRLVLKIM